MSVVRLRQVLALPGANRLELALGVVTDRKRPIVLAVATVGGVVLAGGVVVGLPFAGLPLVLGVAALVAWGWKPARVRAAAVRRLQMHVANATRVTDANAVQVEPERWLAHSDDVIDQALAALPDTWVPPDPADRMLDALRRDGYRAEVHHERALALDYQAPPEPLPDRVTLDVDDAPAGLALRVGWGIDPDTGEQGWAWWDPDAADPHALVVGPTRSGKSVALRGLLSQALAGSWVVLISDPKGVDYRWADGLPGVERASGDNAYEAIDWAVEEMHYRQTWMEEHAAPTATNLGEVEDNPFSPVLVIVDETAELVELGGDGDAKAKKQRRELTRERIGSLARRCRFVQMVLCVATQRPDASILGGEVRGNLGTRVLTGQGEQQHRLMAFGTDDVEPLPAGFPNGRARLMVGGAGPFEIQVPWISAEDVLAAYEPAQDERAESAVPEAWDEQYANKGHERIALDLDGDQDGES